MKKMISAFLLSSLFIFGMSTSAYASETVKGAQKDYENFKEDMGKKLNEAEAQIADLKMKAKNKTSAAQEKTIKELEAQRDALKKQLDKVKATSSDKWSQFKHSFAESVDKLNTKVQDAMKD